MKRLLITLFILAATLMMFQAKSSAQDTKSIELLPTMTSTSTAPNRVWVGTFQIVWNELIDEVIKKPVKFAGYNSETAKLLNKKEFKKSDISEDSYYVKSGSVSPELKTEIETAIKEKFNETSDILDSFDWREDPLKLFIYAMLKKDFKFLTPFDKLQEGGFGNNYTPISYFGINKDSSRRLYKNVSVMFYNNPNDFAVKLFTKSKDIVILYRTDEDTTFDNYYQTINDEFLKFRGNRNFTKDDTLRVPDLDLYLETNFPDVEGHRIKGTNYVIDRTIETVDFKMNNEGVKLKSEAAIMMKMSALVEDKGRNFNCTNNYVLFLIEKGKKVPYYAMKINDVEIFNKTGKK